MHKKPNYLCNEFTKMTDKKYEITSITCSSTQELSKEFKQAHDLVFGSLRLSPIEHDLFALFLARMHDEHWEQTQRLTDKLHVGQAPIYSFNTVTLSTWFNKPPSLLFATLQKAADRLSSRKVGIRNDKDSFKYLPLMSEVSYKDSVLTVTPNPSLMKTYLALSTSHGLEKKSFSLVSNEVFRSLHSEFSKRLYTLLSRFKSGKTTLPSMRLSDLKTMFGYNGKTQQGKKVEIQTGAFMSRVIRHAIKEIGEKEPRITFYSNITDKSAKKQNIGYELTKKGNEITHIKFLFKWDIVVTKAKTNIILLAECIDKMNASIKLNPKEVEFVYTNITDAPEFNLTISELGMMLAVNATLKETLIIDQE